jgi:23S rRNA pseudouridine1911/1915/1917 synthase
MSDYDFSRPVFSVEVEVRPGEEGLRIDRYLSTRFPWRSRQYFRHLIRKSDVTLNGRTPKYSSPVRVGDRVWIRVPEIPGDPRKVPIDVIHEDGDIIVLNKRPGYLVHPAGKTRLETILSALHLRFRNHDDPDRDVVPRHCHRLDRDTSGVLIVAKTLEARRHIQDQFEARTVDKVYFTIVEGDPPEEGVIEIPLMNAPNRRSRMRPTEGGLPCRTLFRKIGTWREFAFLSVRLETGRQHQIRVHLSSIGCPILCDPIYGTRSMLLRGDLGLEPASVPILARHALHCHRMGIRHPATGAVMELVAPPPPDLQKILDLAEIRLEGGTEDGKRP